MFQMSGALKIAAISASACELACVDVAWGCVVGNFVLAIICMYCSVFSVQCTPYSTVLHQ